VFTVPFAGEGGKMPGAQVHASVIDQLLSSRFIRPVSPVLGVALVLGLSLLAAGLVVGASPRIAGPGFAVIAGAVVLLADRLFRHGSLAPLAQPLVGMALAGVGALGYRYFVEGREKRQVKRLFSRYLSRDVYEQVLANPALAELGGRRREMSVLFSDIRGFTSFTEEGHPEAVVAQLNEYFSRMVDVVFAHQGTLDKFVGDMVVALFGAPLDDADHADHALQAALGMLDALDGLNHGWAAAGRPGLRIGIGVNSGEMIAGNIGSERVRSYTVIGDAVNLGARLQGLNKDYGTTILVSEETARRLKGRYDLRPLGTVTVKGRSQPVAILEARRGGAAQGVPDARSHP
jgi:adenylate cyclase